jgi:hypothetical protein
VPTGCGASGAYALGPDERREEEEIYLLLGMFKNNCGGKHYFLPFFLSFLFHDSTALMGLGILINEASRLH